MVSSLDLSSAFYVVKIKLLMKRLRIIGIPEDVVQLISAFLVNINGNISFMKGILLGTVQGSILGPVLYSIYVSPLFDLEYLLAFADDNYIPRGRRRSSVGSTPAYGPEGRRFESRRLLMFH